MAASSASAVVAENGGSGSSELWKAVAAREEDLGEVAARLKDCMGWGGAGLEAVGEDGTTPLQKAASFGRSASVHLLLSQGADPNKPSPSEIYTGYSALHYACGRVGQEDCMRTLLADSRTNVNARNAKGQTALSVACAHGSPGMAQLLLAHPGIDKRATDNDGVSVLMLVAATGRDQFLDVLLQDPEIRATINDADKHGDTALHHAFQIQLQRFFKNAYPVTPVQEALVYRLVRAGADLNAKNRDKLPPRYFASRHYKALLSSVSAVVSAGGELPESLEGLLESSGAEGGLAGVPEGEAKAGLVAALAKYRSEREAALEAQARMGGCPFVPLQPRKRPPAGSDNEDEDEDDEESESESEDSEEESEDDEEEGDSSAESASEGTAGAGGSPPVPSAAAPSGHPSVAAGADISACPFFQKQKAATAAAAAAVATPSAAATTETQSRPTTPAEAVKPAAGKCPIPFHHELADRRNWAFLAILIVAVILARLL